MLSASLELLEHRRQPWEKANQRVSTGPLWEEKGALILTRWKMPKPTGAPLHTAGLISITGRTMIHQQTETRTWISSPYTMATKLIHPPKANDARSPCFRMAIWKSDMVYGATEKRRWGETAWGCEVHCLEGKLWFRNLGTVCNLHSGETTECFQFYIHLKHLAYWAIWFSLGC